MRSKTRKGLPVRLVTNPTDLQIDSVISLLEAAGMRRRNRAEMLRAINGSTQVIGAYLTSGALVGFGRLISDGVFYGTIWDVAVAPAFQKWGIGTVIVNALVKKCRRLGIHMVGLFTVSHNWSFYEHRGFSVMKDVHPMRLQLRSSLAVSHLEPYHEK